MSRSGGGARLTLGETFCDEPLLESPRAKEDLGLSLDVLPSKINKFVNTHNDCCYMLIKITIA